MNFIFTNSVKTYTRLGHDLPASVNSKAITPFSKGFILTKHQ